MVIGVYGLGRFGGFWASSLSKAGFETVAYSRSAHVVPEGVRLVSEEEVLHSDLLFFCVAISSLKEVLEKVGGRVPSSTIVMDTCSVKTYPMEWMRKALPENVYKIGTHPMFGPDSGKNGLKGLPVVMSSMGEKDARYNTVKEVFDKMELKVIEMSADEHDKAAAYSQGITHFVGRILSEMNLENTPIATKGYKSLLEIMEQTCHDPLQLFFDLQRYNPYTRQMRRSFSEALWEVRENLLYGEVDS